ncbi:MAG: hypothetical protein KJI71_01605 [Patescibacteria group bacterium]|nr:hypothetical protein [Patescibacteria group bacterium]
MSLKFNFRDVFEIEIEIYNSKQRLQGWYFDELKLHQDNQVKNSIPQGYKKLSINL